MPHRSLSSTAVVGILGALLLAPARVAAQAPATGRNTPAPTTTARTRTWTVPRTSDGHPDLQGFWNNTTYVPLERPKDVTKEFYTREEAIERIKLAAAAESAQTEPGTIPDVHYDFTQFGLDRSQGPLAPNLRSSLIV